MQSKFSILRVLEEWGWGKRIKRGFIFIADRLEIGEADAKTVGKEGLAIQLTVTGLNLHMVYIIRDKSKLIELRRVLDDLLRRMSPEVV